MTLRGRGRVGRVKYLGVWQRVGPRGGPGGRGGPCVWRRRQTGRAQSSEPRQLRWQQVGCSGSYGGPGRGRGRGTGSGPRAGEGAGVRGQGRGGAGSGGSGVSGMGRCAGPGFPCIPPGARIPQSGHGGGGGGGGGDGVCVAATVCGRWLPGPRPPRRRAGAPVPVRLYSGEGSVSSGSGTPPLSRSQSLSQLRLELLPPHPTQQVSRWGPTRPPLLPGMQTGSPGFL